MTVQNATDMSVAEVLEQLRAEQAAMRDPLDIPGDWTPRQRGAYEARRQALTTFIHGLMNLPTFDPMLVHAQRQRLERLVGIRTALETQLAQSPDPALITDVHECNQQLMQQRVLRESLKALEFGVKYWPNGAPMLSQPLADLLQQTCPTCQHTTCDWPGTIPEVEEALGAMEQRIADAARKREQLIAGAMALLS